MFLTKSLYFATTAYLHIPYDFYHKRGVFRYEEFTGLFSWGKHIVLCDLRLFYVICECSMWSTIVVCGLRVFYEIYDWSMWSTNYSFIYKVNFFHSSKG